MSSKSLASAAALIALVATPAGAAEPLQPTAKWTVDYGDAHCIATRTFGSAGKLVTFAIKPGPMGDVTQLTVVHPMRSSSMNQFRGTLTVDHAAPQPISLVGYPGVDGKLRVTAVNLPRATYDRVRGASLLHLSSPGEYDGTFALTQMADVALALDACIADLQQLWHLGPAAAQIKQKAMSVQPLDNLIRSADYPGVALRGHGVGAVGVMLLISEAGRISSCGVTETSGVASLDAQTCILLTRRARFSPALGADGKPAKSGYAQSVHWKIR